MALNKNEIAERVGDALEVFFPKQVWNEIRNYIDCAAIEISREESAFENQTSVDDDYQVVTTDQMIFVTVADKTITLPALEDAYNSTTGRGQVITIIKMVEDGYMTVQGSGGEQIADPDYGLTDNKQVQYIYESIKVVATATAWIMI